MEDNVNTSKVVNRFFRALVPIRQEVVSLYIYAAFHGLVYLSIPLGIQSIVNFISSGHVSTSWITLVVFVIAGVITMGFLQIAQLKIAENIQQKIFANTAFEFAFRIPRLRMHLVDKFYMPELVNRFFDTITVQKGITKILIDFSVSSLQVLFGLIVLSFYHPLFIFFGILLISAIIIVVRLTSPQGIRTSLKESKYKYEVAHWLEEVADAMATFKLSGNTPIALKNTDNLVQNYLIHRKQHFKVLVSQYVGMIVLKVLIAATLLIMGGWLVITQKMNIGQFVAAEIIIIMVLTSVEKIILRMEVVYDVLTGLQKISDVIELPLENLSEEPNNILHNSKGMELEIQSLYFSFPGEAKSRLNNINLHVVPGGRVCITGKSGSGKSLLFRVIAGLYDNIEGVLSYNSLPFGNIPPASLRKAIGGCLQSEKIISGTILDNITLINKQVSLEKIHSIAKIVGLTNYIKQLEKGYDTTLVSGGRGLTKEIIYKIKLMRSLVFEPKLLLIEDEISTLTQQEKNDVFDYVLDKDKEWTVIVSSTDELVIKKCNNVYILENGTLKGGGVC